MLYYSMIFKGIKKQQFHHQWALTSYITLDNKFIKILFNKMLDILRYIPVSVLGSM